MPGFGLQEPNRVDSPNTAVKGAGKRMPATTLVYVPNWGTKTRAPRAGATFHRDQRGRTIYIPWAISIDIICSMTDPASLASSQIITVPHHDVQNVSFCTKRLYLGKLKVFLADFNFLRNWRENTCNPVGCANLSNLPFFSVIFQHAS
jgi:hypothetical protein